MMTSETIFANGVPIGRIVIDTDSRQIAFIPTITPSKLPNRDFESIDDLRSSVIAAYQRKTKSHVLGRGTG